mgnify:CR=1 FL=1
MEHLCVLSEQEKQKVKQFLQDNEKFQPLSPSEKTELKNCLFSFVKRVSAHSWERNQGELAILPEIVKLLINLR